MTVYVESNFVLEIALGQEQSADAEAILAGAEAGGVVLACPVIAMIEPFSTISHRSRQRRRLIAEFNDQVRELARSRPHQSDVAVLRPMSAVLSQVDQREEPLLLAIVDRILACATLIEFGSSVYARALASYQGFGLTPADSLVYASVIHHLGASSQAGPHYFLSKNSRDFGAPGIRSELRSFNCTFVDSFVLGAQLALQT